VAKAGREAIEQWQAALMKLRNISNVTLVTTNTNYDPHFTSWNAAHGPLLNVSCIRGAKKSSAASMAL